MQRSAVAAALIALIGAAGCSKSQSAQTTQAGAGGGPPRSIEFPVEVQPVRSQLVEYTVSAVGSVEAFEQVEVTARVAGAVEEVRFREGGHTSKDAILVAIEPERYRLAVAAAEANHQKAEAELAEAEAALERREAANAKNPGLIRGEEIATWRTRTQTARAELSQARAALEQARLNLRDAFVRAPVGGTIQTRTVQTGQYVQAGTVLATLVRRDPLLLRFQVPEQDSVRVRPGMPIRFSVGEELTEMTARISHVAESASMSSRMVEVTAMVDDPRRASIKAGAFARVSVPIGSTIDAAVIPQTAIRPSERGFLAFVVDGDVAHERVLTLGMRTAEGAVEVREGLKVGEMLVVRGAEPLRDGIKVRVSQ
ncbi:MAG TPA: efflux RND transporter periplasmic adaptor subunit [Thermoanaerobaculia bacterium]|nr:efflux RND transporter periplasmic adaptor subunit [Thermoanaerobaculia bacterium]